MHISSPDYCQIQSLLPILCVDAVIVHEKRCLLLLRRNQPARGQFWFPGGRVYKNELIADAALRKASEETGLHCEFQSILSVEESLFPCIEDMTVDPHTVNICCHLTVVNDLDISLDDQHDAYRWVDKDTAFSLSLHDCVMRPLMLCLGRAC